MTYQDQPKKGGTEQLQVMNAVKMIPVIAWFEENLNFHNGLHTTISTTRDQRETWPVDKNEKESQHRILDKKTLHYLM